MISRSLVASDLSFTCRFPGRNAYRIAIASWITLALNQPLFHFLPDSYLISTGILLWLINCVLVYLCTPGRLFIPGTLLLMVTASISSYFISRYGIVIDRSMIQNAVETDSKEALELLTPTFFFTVMLGVLPLFFIRKVCNTSRQPWRRLAVYLLILVSLLASLGIVAGTNYQQYAGFFRQNKQIKHIAIPLNVISATESYIRNNLLAAPLPFRQIATNVSHESGYRTPEITVIVVGETARADHFSQNNYERNTTPRLADLDIVNFSNVSSCGTATAHSLPCMFSWMSKDNYDERQAMRSENVFDILARAGVETAWYDNNSGCKGLCERMPNTHYYRQDRCKFGCTDDILNQGLNEFINRVKQQQIRGVVILHQQGSHGPSYYKRSREENKRFGPECTSDTFSDCTQQEIINAYDNSLVETDALLSDVITRLKQSGMPASMLYVSDHGESLGENGVYLHGLPYWMAPDAQTHVPMMLWMSPSFSNRHKLDKGCLENLADQPQSHDILFNTILDITGINITTTEVIPDGIARCRSES